MFEVLIFIFKLLSIQHQIGVKKPKELLHMMNQEPTRIMYVICPVCRDKFELNFEKNFPERFTKQTPNVSLIYKHLFYDESKNVYIEHFFGLCISPDKKISYSETDPGKVRDYKNRPPQDYTYLQPAPLLDPEFRQCVKQSYEITDAVLDQLPKNIQKQLPELLVLAGRGNPFICIAEFLKVSDGKPYDLVVKIVGLISLRDEQTRGFNGFSQRVLAQDITGFIEVTAYTVEPLRLGDTIHIANIKRYKENGKIKIVIPQKIGQICVLPFTTPTTTNLAQIDLIPQKIQAEHIRTDAYYRIIGILNARGTLKYRQHRIDNASFPTIDVVLADTSHKLLVYVKNELAVQMMRDTQLNEIITLTYCHLFVYNGIVTASTTKYSSLTHKQQVKPILMPKDFLIHKISLPDATLEMLAQTAASGTITGWMTKPQLSHDNTYCWFAIVDASQSGYIKTSPSRFKSLAQVLTKDLQLVTLSGVIHSWDYTFRLDESEWKLSLANRKIIPHFIVDTALESCDGLFCTSGLLEKKYEPEDYKSHTGSCLRVLFKINHKPIYLFAHTDKDKAMVQELTAGAVYKIFFVRRTRTPSSLRLQCTSFTQFQLHTPARQRKLLSNLSLSHPVVLSSKYDTISIPKNNSD